MQKQKKQFIIVLILLVVLLLSYVGIRFYNSKQEEKEAEEEAAATITVTDIASDDVTAFSYIVDGTTLSYTKDGDNWTYDGDASLDMDEDSISTMLETACSLTAEEELDEYDSLSDYGLDAPSNTITITTAEGTTTLYLGNENEMTSQYYLMTGDSETVYLIGTSLSSTFSVTADSLVAEEDDTETEETSDVEEVETTETSEDAEAVVDTETVTVE